MEFQSEAWQAAYVQRIDATIAALKSANVPVFWVGLPPQRDARQSAAAVYLNELYRARAERAGIVYVDIWDGFVDEAGRYVLQGPDFEGQIRRLRSGDGIYFTARRRAQARALCRARNPAQPAGDARRRSRCRRRSRRLQRARPGAARVRSPARWFR